MNLFTWKKGGGAKKDTLVTITHSTTDIQDMSECEKKDTTKKKTTGQSKGFCCWIKLNTEIMAVSVTIIVLIISLHLLAFVFAIGAERRRSEVLFNLITNLAFLFLKSDWLISFQAKVIPDEYDERTFCVYTTDASTVYGVAAFSLLLLSQTVLNAVTRCLCCGKGLISGCSTTCAVIFFILSW